MTADQQKNWLEETRYSDLFFRLLDPAFLLNAETLEILEANRSGEATLGAGVEALRGKPLTDWIPQEDVNSLLQQVRITMRRYHPREFEVRVQSPASPEPLLFRFAACQLQTDGTAGSPVLQIIAHDITHQREVELQAAQYLKDLKEALGDLQTANEKLETLSQTDPLTGAFNVRSLQNRLEIEQQRSRRFGRPYAVVFLDLDNFKHYNDHHGHPAGDELLRQLVTILKRSVRDTDFVARYGGEEFVILAAETSQDQAKELADRVQKQIESHPFPHASEQPLGMVSASIGVSSWPDSGTTPEAVLEAADKAMYASKMAGKNRVTLAERL